MELSAVDRGFEPPSGQNKDYKIVFLPLLYKTCSLLRAKTGWLRIRIIACKYIDDSKKCSLKLVIPITRNRWTISPKLNWEIKRNFRHYNTGNLLSFV